MTRRRHRGPRPHLGSEHVYVFSAVLVTGAVLIALGVPVDSLATVCIALSQLYEAWASMTRPPMAELETAADQASGPQNGVHH